MTARFRVVVTDVRHPSFDEERGVLGEIGAELVLADCATAEQVAEACRDADGVLANLAPVTAAAIAAMTRCRVISRYGVGCDSVDVAAATGRGIWVGYVPNYCAEDVSDHALALLLAVTRRVAQKDRSVRAGHWNAPCGKIHRLEGKAFGLIGFGRIARALSRKLAAFRPSRILAHDPQQDAEAIAAGGAVKAELGELLRESDYISLHAPASADTKGLLGREAMSAVKPGAVIINTSRGSLIDEDALIAALERGAIAGAGLDVFVHEPLAADHGLRRFDQVVLTDHAAWYSEESMVELKTTAARNVAAVLAGGRPLHCVNELR